jgi:CheY-like chemotaxis protein
MSHELRTPLNSILGFAQVLSRREIPPDQRKAVDHILKAGRHLLNLINEVLDIARIEANTQDLSMEAVQVRSVVQEALSLIQPLANEHGMRILECELNPEWHVRADRRRLTQVLLNLLSNAVKYNRPHGLVELICQEVVDDDSDGPRLGIGVRDTGKGIPAGRMSELFTPFARLGAEQTEVEGTGLGLALSQRLVQAMNGRLTVESVAGEGSTFTVDLPLALSPQDEALIAGPQGYDEGSGSDSPRRPATLLYIEDNLANLALVETILSSRPELNLLAALKGEMGLNLAWKYAPDVVLLDLHLPDLQGIEVLRRLRADPRTKDVPVIVVSADATAESVARLNAEGARMYLTKPIDVEELIGAVDQILGERAGAEGGSR